MAITRPSNFRLILILGSLIALSPFSIDMYLPAFQQIAADFGIPVSEVSLSLSSYFVGLAAGQLFYGPLLDRFGRKPPLYVGLVIYILTTLACMASKNIETLVVLRFIQAVGGCAASVATIAMIRDFFDGKDAAKVFSLLILILGASPLLAPTTGSFLSVTFGWQSNFIALALIGLALLLVCIFFLPEGHKPDKTQSLKLGPIFKTYFSILQEPQFYTYTFSGALAFSGLFVYLASSPVIFMEIYNVKPTTYGAIFGALAAGFIGCSQLNILLMKKYSSQQILRVGLICLASAGSLFMIGSFFDWFNLPGTILILFLYLSSAGIVNPNAQSLAMAPFTKTAGSASALMGALSMGVGAAGATSVSFIHATKVFPFTFVFAGSGILALIILLLGSQKIKRLKI